MSGNQDIDVNFDEIEDIPFALDDFIKERNGEIRVEVDVGGRSNTVEPREFYRFEEDIIDLLTERKLDKYRRGSNIPIKGRWIHGWLEENGEDYIASIFRNWQLFLKYVEGRTERMNTAGTVNRAPGTYDSMYTYLLVLEKLGLVERFRREEIPEEDFSHNVPDDFQDRTYLRVTESFEDRREDWRNPFKAQYPGAYEDDDTDDVIEETDEPEQIDDVDEDNEVEEQEETDEDSEGFDPESIDDISDFANTSGFTGLVDETFEDVMQSAIDDPPVPGASENIQVDDFSRGRIGIYGQWAEGDVEVGETELKMLVEIINESAPRSPPFITAGAQTRYNRGLNTNNPLPELFPSYEVGVVYSGGFSQAIQERVKATQDGDEYYEITSKEFIEI